MIRCHGSKGDYHDPTEIEQQETGSGITCPKCGVMIETSLATAQRLTRGGEP